MRRKDDYVVPIKSCCECGAPADHDHHVVPQSKGGTFTVPLCGRCHGLVHDVPGLISNRALTKAALQAKRQRNERVGAIPYGWVLKPDGKTLEPCDHEQQAIMIAKLMRGKGMALAKIGRELLIDGFNPRSGKEWHPEQVKRLVEARGAC